MTIYVHNGLGFLLDNSTVYSILFKTRLKSLSPTLNLPEHALRKAKPLDALYLVEALHIADALHLIDVLYF